MRPAPGTAPRLRRRRASGAGPRRPGPAAGGDRAGAAATRRPPDRRCRRAAGSSRRRGGGRRRGPSRRVADDRERGGRGLPPLRQTRDGVRAVVAARDGEDRRLVVRPRRLDHERLRAAGEERLAHDRIGDEVEHVRRVAPQLRVPRLPHLAAQPSPRRPAEVAVPARIGARRNEEIESRTASCTKTPSLPQSVTGSSNRRSKAPSAPGPGSIATSSGRVTRRTTAAASSASRVTGSGASSRYIRVSSPTTRVVAASSSIRSGRSRAPRRRA